MANMLVKVLMLSALPLMAMAVPADELTFATVAAWPLGAVKGQQNTTGQFTMTFSWSSPTVAETPIICTSQVENACYNSSNPPKAQPLLVLSEDKITMTATYKWGAAPLQTYQNATPVNFQGRMCYSLFSATDRKWRKKNKPYPGLTMNCPFKFPKTAVPVDLTVPYVTVMDLTEEDLMPTSTFFFMLWIECGEDATVCAFESTENKIYVQTKVYDTVTTEMVIVSIVFSVLSGVIFFSFFAFDYFYFKKTGRGFYF